MGKYYYVQMVNPAFYREIGDGHELTETWKLAKKHITVSAVGYDNDSAMSLLNVKRALKHEDKKMFGIPYTKDYIGYDPCYMICEDLGNCLQDIITGKNYEVTDLYTHPYSKRLVLRKACEISSDEVVMMLSSLSPEDLIRYRKASENLNNAISFGYDRDISRLAMEQQAKLDNDAYIRSFRKK